MTFLSHFRKNYILARQCPLNMGNTKDFLIVGGLVFLLYMFNKNQGGGGTFPFIDTPSINPSAPTPILSAPTYDSPANNRDIFYPGIKADTSSISVVRIATPLNRAMPSDIATNPAYLIRSKLPGGSGGVISGLIESSRNAAPPSNMLRIATPLTAAPKPSTSQKIDKILSKW
jgi:hypothetical protein